MTEDSFILHHNAINIGQSPVELLSITKQDQLTRHQLLHLPLIELCLNHASSVVATLITIVYLNVVVRLNFYNEFKQLIVENIRDILTY